MTEGAKISTYEDGPYLVTGVFRVVDVEGDEFSVDKETVALCRCGASTKKPFCDGAHSKVGVRAAERAVGEYKKVLATRPSLGTAGRKPNRRR